MLPLIPEESTGPLGLRRHLGKDGNGDSGGLLLRRQSCRVLIVFSTDVIVEHFAQHLLTFEAVACEMKLNGSAKRANTIEEIIFWLGLYDQFRFVHPTIMPQRGAFKEPSLKNYDELEKALHFVKPGVKSTQKSVVGQH